MYATACQLSYFVILLFFASVRVTCTLASRTLVPAVLLYCFCLVVVRSRGQAALGVKSAWGS